jgi:hypothetical protein
MVNATSRPRPAIQYLHASLIAILLVGAIAVRTNSMPPKYDGLQYVDMARNGIIGNPNLVSPMAYRPGMPFASRVVADLLSVPVESGFRIFGWISSLCFLICVFALARHFAVDYRHALLTMVILGLSFAHIKFPLFFYTLVDVSAYPLMVLSFWALVTRRHALCLLVSSVGVLFKEFLAIPLFLVILHFGWAYWHGRSGRNLARLVVALGIGVSVVLIPRLCIPVSATGQFVDPLNNPGTLKNVLIAPLDEGRLFNIMFAVAGYWLPTILLLTRSRIDRVWADLRGATGWAMAVSLLLVVLLTMYGGTNIFVFVAYSVAVQTVVLALLFRHGVGVAEGIYVVAVTLLFNKVLLHVPPPADGFGAYVDFYGGYSSRVALPSLMRSIEMGAYVILAMAIRAVAARIASDRRRDAEAREAAVGRP